MKVQGGDEVISLSEIGLEISAVLALDWVERREGHSLYSFPRALFILSFDLFTSKVAAL